MDQTHPGVLELAQLVALLDAGAATAAHRERAVALALELYAIDEVSRMKLLEVAQAAGPTRQDLDAAVKAAEEEPLGG